MRSMLAVGVFVLTILSSACSGDGGGNNGPTAPPPPANRRLVAVTFTLANADNANTIQEVRLSLDSQVVDTYQGNPTNVTALIGSVTGVVPGSHTVAVTIVRQARSPSRYVMGNSLPGSFPNTIVVNNDRGQTLAIITLPRDVVSMRTGDTQSYRIDVP